MSNETKLQKEAMHVLKLTSRTFYIPIKLLNPTLRKTVGSAYLCMRAIDEIEDHEDLQPETKQHLLRSTSKLLQTDFDDASLSTTLKALRESFTRGYVKTGRLAFRMPGKYY